MRIRPFRAPHHNASLNALIGGGTYAQPGEVSLAHGGVLFLDELAEFYRSTLDALRQPLEKRKVTISRVNGNHTYPINFMFIAAMNPCPCGYYPNARCKCTDYEVQTSSTFLHRFLQKGVAKNTPYSVYNIGGGQPENLLDYISTLQEELLRAGFLPADYDFEAHRELVGMQADDVPVTYADSSALEKDYGCTPRIGIREGLRAFAEWYAEYIGVRRH